MIRGHVLRINIKPETEGERGIPKYPVSVARVLKSGIEGDFNRHRYEHGNIIDKALLVLPYERLVELNGKGWPVKFGDLGENITTIGITYDDFQENSIYKIGDDISIQLTRTCKPCKNLAKLPYVGEEKVANFISILLGNRGWYARVLREGEIRQGMLITKV